MLRVFLCAPVSVCVCAYVFQLSPLRVIWFLCFFSNCIEHVVFQNFVWLYFPLFVFMLMFHILDCCTMSVNFKFCIRHVKV